MFITPRIALALAALAVLLAASPLPAADPARAAEEYAGPTGTALAPNAALRYWQAFDRMPRTQADLDTLQNWKTAALTDELRDQSARALWYLHEGARYPGCNWGLNYSEGPMLLLPHLAKGRDLARLACLTARYQFARGHNIEAVDLLCDALCLARHIGQDGSLIGLLVRFGMEAIVIDTLAPQLNTLPPEVLNHLSARLDALPKPLNMADVVIFSEHSSLNWTIQRLRSGQPTDWKSIFGDSYAEAARFFEQNRAEAIREVEQLRPYYPEAQKLLSAGLTQQEFATQIRDLRTKYSEIPLSKEMLEEFVPSYDAQAAANTRMALLRAAIAVIQKGPDAIAGLTDPINREKVTHSGTPQGFTLTSSVTQKGQQVILQVGPATPLP